MAATWFISFEPPQRRMLNAPNFEGATMTLCPIAIVASCAKCPAVLVCPLKSVIGDAVKPEVKQATAPKKKK